MSHAFTTSSVSSTKPTIAVDVDEVLFPLLHSLVDFFNENYVNCTVERSIIQERTDEPDPSSMQLISSSDSVSHSFTLCHISEFKPGRTYEEVWGCSFEIASKIVEEYISSEYFCMIEPLAGASEVLQRLAERYRLIIVSSRHEGMREQTEAFLDKHYPNLFDKILLGNHWATTGRKCTKLELCNFEGARILIDDTPLHVLEVEEGGLGGILFGNYPWNDVNEDFSGRNIQRVHKWAEIPDAIETLLRRLDGQQVQ